MNLDQIPETIVVTFIFVGVIAHLIVSSIRDSWKISFLEHQIAILEKKIEILYQLLRLKNIKDESNFRDIEDIKK